MKLNYTHLLDEHIARLDAVLTAMTAQEASALESLAACKAALGQNLDVQDTYGTDYYVPAIYNALATINTAPEQTQLNVQLKEAVADAREELALIREALLHL